MRTVLMIQWMNVLMRIVPTQRMNQSLSLTQQSKPVQIWNQFFKKVSLYQACKNSLLYRLSRIKISYFSIYLGILGAEYVQQMIIFQVCLMQFTSARVNIKEESNLIINHKKKGRNFPKKKSHLNFCLFHLKLLKSFFSKMRHF